MTTKVYLRKSSAQSTSGYIWISYYVGRDKVNYSTRVQVKVKDWDSQKSLVLSSDPGADDKNLIVANHVANITKTDVRMKLLGRHPTKESFLRALRRPSDYDTFYDFCDEVMRKTAPRLRASTRNGQQQVIKKLKMFRPGLSMDEVTVDLLDDFLGYLVGECGNNMNTVNKNLSTVKKFVIAAVKQGYMDENPFDGWYIPGRNPSIVYLTEEELQRLIYIYKEGELEYTTYRSLEVFLFLCFSSLHIGDARRLRIEQLGRESFTYYRLKLETRNPRPIIVPISDSMRQIASNMTGNRKKGLIIAECPADQVMNRALKDVAKMADIDKPLTLKCGRHTFATLYASATHDLLSLKSILGHSDIKDTLVYAHVIEDDKKIGVWKTFDRFSNLNVRE